MFDYAARQRNLWERLEAEGVDALFLAPSADLEYLTGVERQVPNFGEVAYAHGWVAGAFFRADEEPVFLFPRMFAAFDLHELPAGRMPIETRLVEDTVRRERLEIEDESVADRVHERYPTDEPEEKESFLDRTVRKVIS